MISSPDDLFKLEMDLDFASCGLEVYEYEDGEAQKIFDVLSESLENVFTTDYSLSSSNYNTLVMIMFTVLTNI